MNNGPREMELKWQAPPQDFYKANWDISISTNRKCMDIGIIIRDDGRRVLAGKNKTIMAGNDPTTGEALAALYAAKFRRDSGFFQIIFW